MMRKKGNVSIRFFFQAEDGIRDIGVTGVQTCALPISCGLAPAPKCWSRRCRGCWTLPANCRTPPRPDLRRRCRRGASKMFLDVPAGELAWLRSEERRVGKECRFTWAEYDA